MNERRRPQIGGHGAKLPRKQEAALAALLQQPTIEKAAVAAGVADSTLRRWLTLPEFRRRYGEARRRLVDAAVLDLQRGCGSAVRALVGIVADAAQPPAVRVSAARAILDSSFKGAELLDLAERVAALETALENRGTYERPAATACPA